MIPMGMSYHTDDFKTAWGDGNIAAAEKILKGLGYTKDKPFTFDLWYTPEPLRRPRGEHGGSPQGGAREDARWSR